jgi:hypothetical protein
MKEFKIWQSQQETIAYEAIHKVKTILNPRKSVQCTILDKNTYPNEKL